MIIKSEYLNFIKSEKVLQLIFLSCEIFPFQEVSYNLQTQKDFITRASTEICGLNFLSSFAAKIWGIVSHNIDNGVLVSVLITHTKYLYLISVNFMLIYEICSK